MNFNNVSIGKDELIAGEEIPAGTVTITLMPEGYDRNNPEWYDMIKLEIPYGTVAMFGQQLDRSLYPELSPIYAGTGKGSFTHIFIEDVPPILLGFEENEAGTKMIPVYGIACIYYQTVKWDDEEDNEG